MSGGTPIQGTQAPQISEGRSQNSYEDDGLDITGPAQFPESNGPGKKEHGFHIENHKEHRDQIKFGRQAQAREADSDDTTIKRFIRRTRFMAFANDIRKRHDPRNK